MERGPVLERMKNKEREYIIKNNKKRVNPALTNAKINQEVLIVVETIIKKRNSLELYIRIEPTSKVNMIEITIKKEPIETKRENKSIVGSL